MEKKNNVKKLFKTKKPKEAEFGGDYCGDVC